ncbi:hypothetical protein BDZ85DRAFT_55291 [Elsinoe ampelina]|uniref:Uncharacterized protein n=1 Tax=Elsinoe ampelina TaxID=302913 RepID=A0A6A6GMP5_9PEZI|nr:hypothetical protein BDZ85DRAFT_55291 [Elsinoe ampelina]
MADRGPEVQDEARRVSMPSPVDTGRIIYNVSAHRDSDPKKRESLVEKSNETILLSAKAEVYSKGCVNAMPARGDTEACARVERKESPNPSMISFLPRPDGNANVNTFVVSNMPLTQKGNRATDISWCGFADRSATMVLVFARKQWRDPRVAVVCASWRGRALRTLSCTLVGLSWLWLCWLGTRYARRVVCAATHVLACGVF